MKNNFIYITFFDYFQSTRKVWLILTDESGQPFTHYEDAKKFATKNFRQSNWGISDYGQMMLDNCAIDNF